jgi:hypothetical protein
MSIEPRTAVAAALAALVSAGVLWRGPLIHLPAEMTHVTVDGVRRPEGCLRCHFDVQGLGPSHEPSALGCSACHLGDSSALDAESAHRGMVVLSGDLRTAERTCGQRGCHPSEADRVFSSIMAGAPGLLAVNRFAFGERDTPAAQPATDDLRRIDATREPATAAESHVRKLCGSCHLAAPKERPGDLGFDARGGGCTACHLAAPFASGAPSPTARLHPDVSSFVAEARCEGCHSRSGRIALSFHGKFELQPPDSRIVGQLPDGRSYGLAAPDVHEAAGMTCIDCHVERELMGDGKVHGHSREATHVRCEDCHGPFAQAAATSDEERRVQQVLRDAWEKNGRAPLPPGSALTTRHGSPLWRTNAKSLSLTLAVSGEQRSIVTTAAAAHHTLRGHERLSCQACHTRWAPRCPTCHTRYDPAGSQLDHLSGKLTAGAWEELPAKLGVGEPALALGASGRIEPFVEGMTLRVEGWGPVIERKLWAPLDPHTTSASRTCASCHAPEEPGLLMPPEGETTRAGARLLDEHERARVLAVGACLPCHGKADDPVYKDFVRSRARLDAARKGEPMAGNAARCAGR